MMTRHHKPKTLFRSILLILCGTAILQGIIFLSVLSTSDTLKMMEQDDYEMLSERVEYRSKEITSILNEHTHDPSVYQGVIESARVLYHTKNEDINGINQTITNQLINVINSFKCSGAFVILDKETLGLPYYPTLYLRDSEPTTITPNNGDLTALFGQSSLIKEMNLPMEPIWTTSIDLTDKTQESSFYFTPVHHAKENPTYNSEDLGFWSPPFRINEEDYEIITYSMPIRDENQTVIGVVGLEFSTDFLESVLTYEELDNSLSNAYLLGILNDDGSMSHSLISGPAYRYLDQETIYLEQIENTTYRLENLQEESVGAASYLNLYTSNTPFSSQKWVLLGVVSKAQLLSNVYTLQKTTYISIAVAMIAALLAAIWASYRFSTPFIQLKNRLKEGSCDGKISLPRVDISEIDDLSLAIEDLSKDVAYASSRLSQILKIVNIQVGAVEYSLTRDHVFCTEMVTSLLEFKNTKENMSHLEFEEEMDCFKQKIQSYEWEEGNAHSNHQIILIKYCNTHKDIYWIRIHVMKHKEEYLLVINNVSEEIFEKKRLEHERDHDALTNLLNRRAFKEQITQKLQEPQHQQGVMVMWDLDNLKYINDTYGHDMGDRYIRTAAEVLGSHSPAHAITSRMAGDEFLIYLYEYPSIKDYKNVIRNLHKTMQETTLELPDGSLQPIRASAGIAWYPQDGNSYEDLLKHADYAMYDAKNSIKGSIKEFNSNSYDKDKILINGKEELNRIIEENLVRFVYQPIVNAKTGEIFGYEALMRPISETITSPLDLFRLAKAQRKLYQMEWLTWKNVMEDCHNNDAFLHNRKLFVNSIPNAMLSLDDLAYLEKISGDYLSHIVIEIIESDDLDFECMKHKQAFAQKHHEQFAIDDFGSGYNNDGMLLKITPEYIKIDMEIIQGVASDKDREQLVKNLVQFAHSKHILVIAEGIETIPDLKVCVKLGVDLLQGYYLGKPGALITALPQEKIQLLLSLNM